MHSPELVRRLALVIALVSSFLFALSVGALAQNASATPAPHVSPTALAPPGLVELGLGYTYLRLPNADVPNLNGFDASIFINLISWLALGGEFTAGFGSSTQNYPIKNTDYTSERYLYLFGPRFSVWPSDRVRLFVQTLIGAWSGHDERTFFGIHQTRNFNGLAAGLGGGADWRLTRHFSWRVVEGDYMPGHSKDTNEWHHNFRISSGVVYTFGGKE